MSDFWQSLSLEEMLEQLNKKLTAAELRLELLKEEQEEMYIHLITRIAKENRGL